MSWFKRYGAPISLAHLRGLAFAILALLAVVALAGCKTDEPLFTGSIPSTEAPSIAFESIDGPPKPVFDRLVTTLSAEAEARKLPVVSRTGLAAYRVRAYLAAHVEKKQARLAWVWEVFDARQNRAFRLSGEETLGPSRGDIWAQCNDSVLASIAAKGFDALAARLGSGPDVLPPDRKPPGRSPEVAATGARQTAAYAAPRD